MKICRKCGDEINAENISNSKSYPNDCKKCINLYHKEYQKKHNTNSRYYQANKTLCKERAKKWHLANKEKVKECQRKSIRKPEVRFNAAKKTALKRLKEWFLSKEEYFKIIANPCNYCNGYFSAVETGSGLDRLDNSIGYTFTNVVSCCYTCNKIKSDVLSADEAKLLISILIEKRTSN